MRLDYFLLGHAFEDNIHGYLLRLFPKPVFDEWFQVKWWQNSIVGEGMESTQTILKESYKFLVHNQVVAGQ
jgi:hypothetical protein